MAKRKAAANAESTAAPAKKTKVTENRSKKTADDTSEYDCFFFIHHASGSSSFSL
jgi:hypothetical protein